MATQAEKTIKDIKNRLGENKESRVFEAMKEYAQALKFGTFKGSFTVHEGMIIGGILKKPKRKLG